MLTNVSNVMSHSSDGHVVARNNVTPFRRLMERHYDNYTVVVFEFGKHI